MIDFRYILIFFLSTSVCSLTKDLCLNNNDSCLCQINETTRIDISKVLSADQILNDTIGNNTYTYLGCRDRKHPDDETAVGVLVLAKYMINFVNNTNTTTVNSTTNYTVIGKANQLKFGKDDNDYFITFVNPESKDGQQPLITLLCDHYSQPFLKVLDDTKQKLLLSSPQVCLITEQHGMSGGAIFLLILFIFACIYLIGGALLLYFIRGARGVEMIPNVEFWKNLPGLVKDGVIFLLAGCRPTFVTTAETYDRI